MGCFNHQPDHRGVFCRLARWTSPRSHLWWRGEVEPIWISVAIEFWGSEKTKNPQGALEDTQKPWKPTVYVRKVFRIVGIFLEVWGYLPRVSGQNHWTKQGSNNRKTHPQTSNWEIFPGFFFAKKIQAFPDSLAEPLLRRCGKLWHLGGTFDVEKCHVMCSVYEAYIYIYKIYTYTFTYISYIYIYNVYIQFRHPVAGRWMFVAKEVKSLHPFFTYPTTSTSATWWRVSTHKYVVSEKPAAYWIPKPLIVLDEQFYSCCLGLVDFVEFSKNTATFVHLGRC